MIYLKFHKLKKQFGYKLALQEVTSSIQSQQYISLLGANGAGKTTLLYLLSGLYRKDGGTISFPSRNIASMKDLYKHMQVLSHQPMFYSRLSAKDNLAFFSAIAQHPPTVDIDTVLKITNLNKVQNQKVDEFSRGMLQRLSLAKMLLFQPSLLLLDEPFTGLDVAGQKLLYNILLTKGYPQIDWQIDAFVLVDHDLPRAIALSNHCWLIEKGFLTIDQKTCSQKELLQRLEQ